MRIDVHFVNSLTDNEAGGNPAGVVTEGDALNDTQKLEVARQVGLSETAFVSRSEIATIKLEFFTPTRQIAHCGHATIATFSLLRQLGKVADGWLTKETVDGCRRVLVEGGEVLMEQRSPTYNEIDKKSALVARIAQSIGTLPADFHVMPTVVSTGNRFLIITLPDERCVVEARPDFPAIKAISDELDLIGYYLYCTSTKVAGRHAGTRMFAPRFGINEESATGTAAGPLACFLHDRMGIEDRHITIEQGRLMQPASPSVINVNLEISDCGISRLMAGGKAVVTSSKRVEI
ncbi:PhzF family phenazine biosynthesis protein [Paraburkholderia bryophila]|uniref:PhzF family phenazine biosynthesis protein n=1 Tax=Paraburkholderia bryophila TaxID=420952 RepID=A0A7Y9W6D4_9BURK|nr:PhzF family phenazine biosynthesis protein [Paraburkholderia bryophila]NYH14807.1 PhzF family phenazine biosynthesis protein [Paraburkholderia bryophila]